MMNSSLKTRVNAFLGASLLIISMNVFASAEPVISYLSGSGPFPNGTREVEINVVTDVVAQCRGNSSDTGEFLSWKKIFPSADGLTHTVRSKLSSDSNINRYIRCRNNESQIANSSSFEFPILFGNVNTLAKTENFSVDRPNSDNGIFTLSWWSVAGANQYRLLEKNSSGLWDEVPLSNTGLSETLSRANEGSYHFRITACLDDARENCGEFSDEVVVWVGSTNASLAPVISYVSGSGPYPNGVDTVEMVVSTDVEATCKSNYVDTGVYASWPKTFKSVDNQLHRLTIPVSGSSSSEKYVRCQADTSLATNEISFAFPIYVNPQSNLARPKNFNVDNAVNSGNYTLNWDSVVGAVTYLIKERTSDDDWIPHIISGDLTSLNVIKAVDGNYEYVLFACEDEMAFDCGACSAHITVSVYGSSGNNLAPVITSSPLLSATENAMYEYSVIASDPDTSDVLTYTLTTAPTGMSIIAESGVINWIPDNDQVGTQLVTILVIDNAGGSVTQSYSIEVSNTNQTPTITSDPIVNATQDLAYRYEVNAQDPDVGDVLTFSLITPPNEMTIESSTGVISWNPNHLQTGEHAVTVVVTDAAGLSDSQSFTITVENVNDAPLITSTPVTSGEELMAYAYQLVVVDNDGDSVQFVLNQKPDGMAISAEGLINWTPSIGQSGENQVSVSVTDINNASVTQDFIIQVAPVPNTAPVADNSNVFAYEDVIANVVLTASDVDNDSLTYSILTQPSNGVLIGTAPNLMYLPNANFNGVDSFSFNVNDGIFDSNVAAVEISVVAVNDLPVAQNLDLTGTEDSDVVVLLTGSDSDGDNLIYEVVSQPANGSLSGTPPNLVYTPNENFNGTDSFTYRANDGIANSSDATVNVVLDAVNDAPVMNILSPIESEVLVDNVSVSLTASALDAEDGNISSSIRWVLNPGEIAIGTGESLSTSLTEGAYSVTATVSDTDGFTLSESVNFLVEKLNIAPLITSTPIVEINEGAQYIYDLDATDADGDSISYSLVKGPNDMQIDPVSGLINWTAGSSLTNSDLSSNKYCRIPASSQIQVPVAMDAVMVVDGSLSNEKTWPWVAGAMATLNAQLRLSGVGVPPEENKYGLVGFGSFPETKLFDSGMWGTIKDLYEATYDGRSPGGVGAVENGLRALQYTIDNYSFRENVAKNLIWIPDEEQQGVLTDGETLENLTQRLIDGNFNLNVVTIVYFKCFDGRDALGFDADGNGYVATDNDGFEYCDVDTSPIYESTGRYRAGFVEPFILTALETGGAVWSLSAINNFPHSASMHKAIASRMFSTTLVNEQQNNQADIAISQITIAEGNSDLLARLDAKVINRGLAAFEQSVAVKFVNVESGEILNTQTLSGLLVGEEVEFSAQVEASAVNDHIEVVVEFIEGEECLIDNNRLTVPFLQVQASDNKGGNDNQIFGIIVQNVNEPPHITSTPFSESFVGQKYQYQVEIVDPDIGDAHQFSFIGNGSATIDKDSGLFVFRPVAEDIGEQEFTINVLDLAGEKFSQTFTLTVSGDYIMPLFNGSPEDNRAIIENIFRFTPTVTSDPTALLTFTLLESPDGMDIDAFTGAISWIPTLLDFDRLRLVSILVEDQFGNSDLLSFVLFGDYENSPPRITSTPKEIARLNTYYSYYLNYDDDNAREDFSLDIATSAVGIQGVIHQDYGLDRNSTEIYWRRWSVAAQYPRHMKNNDFLCLDFSVNHPASDLPLTSQMQISAGYFGSNLMAAPLTDTNGDGFINLNDESAVLVTSTTGSTTLIKALNGKTGEEFWAYDFNSTNTRISHNYAPAIADLTSDGVPDILLVESSTRFLVAVSSDDGRVLWKSSVPIASYGYSSGQITITDLEGDGEEEILAGFSVFDKNGNLKFSFDEPNKIALLGMISPIYPVDLNGDGIKEVVQSGTVLSSNGDLLWRVAFNDGHGSPLSYSAFANFDSDENPEMVFVERGDGIDEPATISLLDDDGSYIWQPKPIDFIGQPIIGDFDSDGVSDIFVPGSDVLLDREGNEKWKIEATNYARGDGNAATAFDLQGNGRVELILNRNFGSTIFDGLTGSQMNQSTGNYTNPKAKPLIVDLDHDGKVEIVAAYITKMFTSSYTGSMVNHDIPKYQSQNLWYKNHLTNEMKVNNLAENHWTLNNSDQLAYPSKIAFSAGLPDLWVNVPRGDRNTQNVEIYNRGTADYNSPFEVQLYAGDPLSGGILLSTQSIDKLPRQVATTLQFNNVVPESFIGELVAKIEPMELVNECQINNNIASAYTFDITISDYAGAQSKQDYLFGVEYSPAARSLTYQAPPEVVEGEEFVFDLDYNVDTYKDDNNTGTFFVTSGPEGLTVDSRTGVVKWTPNYRQAGSHVVNIGSMFLVGQTGRTFTITVLPSSNTPPVIFSTPASAAILNQLFIYEVGAQDQDGDLLNYTLRNSPASMAIDANTGIINWTPETTGVFSATIVVSDGKEEVTQTISLTVNSQNDAPLITSTPNFYANPNKLYAYSVLATDANGDSITFSLNQKPTGMSINETSGLLEWLPSFSQEGEHLVEIVVTDSSGLIAIQTYTLIVRQFENNNPPVITSLPDGNATFNIPYLYNIEAHDVDGDTLSFALIAAPSGMSIDNVSGVLSWLPNILHEGLNDIVIRVDDGKGSYTLQSFSIVVSDGSSSNSTPNIDSQPGFNAKINFEYEYQLVASDSDNDPLTFELTESPTEMTISPTGLIRWTPTNLQSRTIRARVSDGLAYIEQIWELTVLSSDAVSSVELSVTPRYVNEGDMVTIQVIPVNMISPLSISLTIDGNEVVLDSTHQAEIVATGSGSHAVLATVTDKYETIIETSTFGVIDPNDSTFPSVSISQPLNSTIVTEPTPIIASISDDNIDNWLLVYQELGNQNSDFVILAEGTSNVSEEVLAVFDPTMLLNGQYAVILQATDANGQVSYASASIIVKGDLKVGNFTITLEDKNIPLAGLPIRVTRTYDSRRKAEALDFGYGWSVGYQDIKVNESSEPTLSWEQYSSHSTFNIDGALVTLPSTCTRSVSEKIVTITLPSGDVESFIARGRPIGHGAIAITDPDCTLVASRYIGLMFDPTDDTDSKLVSLDGNNLYLSNPNGGNLALDIVETEAFDVQSYQLTTRTGYVYKLNQYFGIETITDPNGNTLTYSDSGIVHSSGKSVLFNRDSSGRITSIIDPSGNVINYTYNTSGNLTSSTDELGHSTNYLYNAEHGLLDIIDPLGRTIVKNIYNDEGRLIAQEDNQGHQTSFEHDLVGRQSVVTDRLGRITTLYYDEEGNVTSQVDADSKVTSFVYDDNGNQLSKTDPLMRTTSATYDEEDNQLTQTDALTNTVSFTYNSFGQELTITDEKENVFSNVYDSVGNLLSITDPDEKTVSNVVNAQGLPVSVSDALLQVTSYTYDNSGNKLTETDPLLNVTSYTYDDNNNVLTESRDRTLADGSVVTETTTFEYDKMNRVIKTIDHLNHEYRIEFDKVGNQVASIDALNRRTEMDYDVYGRLIETRYHDTTKETKTYDLEGNLLSETDRNNNLTQYEYDKLNRLVKTIYADLTFTQTEYDAAGQVVASIDARDQRTEYEYDLAGRRIKTINALLQPHHFAYDKSGNLASETDALNRTTTYTYDKLDRKTKTTLHNLSTLQDGFDALARKTSSTDQANITTHYGYDKLGRLLSVTDIEGNVTSFTYDEVGNKLTQTDALLRTTSWTYDALGRVLSRTLPMGQVESFTYDVLGNLKTHTDFNGDLITYTYDVMNRVTLISYAKDSSTQSFTYDNNGNRLTATNADGSWIYTYDVMNRLASETQPNGDKLEYTYDANGNKTQLKVIYANGDIRIESFTYDVLNRLLTVKDADANLTSYDYDAVGNRISVIHSNANVTAYVYDELNRLIQMQDKRADETVYQQFDYTLHITGRREKITELNGRVSDYSYDTLYRLTDEVISDPVNGNYTANYTFDKVGNRVGSTINGVSTVYTYDKNDRLTQEGGEVYTYDDMGNTLSQSIDNDITTYTYDARQKLIHADILVSGELRASDYRYNVDGIRIQKTDAGEVTNYLVDSNRDYAQVIAETNDANTIQVEYVFGDDLLAQKRGSTLSNYQYDGLGSTRALTDSTGSVSDEYFYDAFGVELARTGSTENDYLFTGEQYDAGLGNYYLRARYYDQGIGRFTQQDTWMGVNSDPVTLHKYLYANADPVSYMDPTGNFSIGSLMSAVNTAATLVTVAETSYSIGGVLYGAVVNDEPLEINSSTVKQVGFAVLFSSSAGKIMKYLARNPKYKKLFKLRTLYRGVNKDHDNYGDALRGFVPGGWDGLFMSNDARTGAADQHNQGVKFNTPFSSWSARRAIAKTIATRATTSNGVVIRAKIMSFRIFKSPDRHGIFDVENLRSFSREHEFLVVGPVQGIPSPAGR